MMKNHSTPNLEGITDVYLLHLPAFFHRPYFLRTTLTTCNIGFIASLHLFIDFFFFLQTTNTNVDVKFIQKKKCKKNLIPFSKIIELLFQIFITPNKCVLLFS